MKKISTRLFNIRLYIEGLKRLRVIGLATTILSLTVSALIPIVYWVSAYQADLRYRAQGMIWNIEELDQVSLCVPLYLIPLLAPFFFMVLFSFLHKRKDSDFYHAIPYTRTCTYVSYVAAALTFVFGIMMASSAVAGTLWALCPYATYAISDLISLLLICMLTAAMLSGFMMLAISLTGTASTTILLFGLFTFLVRVVTFLFSMLLESLVDILVVESIPFLNPYWFLPFGLYESLFNSYHDAFSPFGTLSNIIYSIIVTLVLFSAAWFFYKIRKSEMAGHTAPNRLAQHIFRCLFTLPFSLLIPTFIMADGFEFSLFMVLLVITLLVYYLYELITTKRIKNMITATPFLATLLIGILLFAGAFLSVRAYVLTEDINADDIASVKIDTDNRYSYNNDWDTYQKLLLKNKSSTDQNVIATVSDALTRSQYAEWNDDYEYYMDYGKEGSSYRDRSYLTVRITLDSGRTIYRSIMFRDEELAEFQIEYVASLALNDTFWDLPDRSFLESLDGDLALKKGEGVYQYEWLNYNHIHPTFHDLLNVIYNEYNALPDTVKPKVRGSNDLVEEYGDTETCNLHLYGELEESFAVRLFITPDTMPRSFAVLKEAATSYEDAELLETKVPIEFEEKTETPPIETTASESNTLPSETQP